MDLPAKTTPASFGCAQFFEPEAVTDHDFSRALKGARQWLIRAGLMGRGDALTDALWRQYLRHVRGGKGPVL